MITFDEFNEIDTEVQNSINALLDSIKAKSQNYILLLANAEYMNSLHESRLNPHAIDSAVDMSIDRTRRQFFSDYMTDSYAFPNRSSLASNVNAIQLELMIYTHIWESKPLLKTLRRLAILADNDSYPWDIQVPSVGKEDFIRKKIRNSLKKNGHAISTVMTKGFNSSLRNAFAHSDYYLRYDRKEIVLTNYTGKDHQLPLISFNDWRKMFSYSALLSHYLLNEIYIRRLSVIKDFGTDTFVFIHPTGPRSFKARKLKYDESADHFNFTK